MRAAAEAFFSYIVVCFRSFLLLLISCLRERFWPPIAPSETQEEGLQGEEKRLLEKGPAEGSVEGGELNASLRCNAALHGTDVSNHDFKGALEDSQLSPSEVQARINGSGSDVISAGMAEDCCTEKTADLVERPESLLVQVPEQQAVSADDMQKEFLSRTSSCVSPRGPLDLKSLAVSDSETDLSVQHFEGEHAGSLLPELIAEEQESLVSGLEPAPFECQEGRFFFTNPRVHLGSGANGDVERILWLGPDASALEPFAVKVMTPPAPAPGLGYKRNLAKWQRSVRAEVDILERVQGCPHVVQHCGTFTSADGTVFIIMRLAEGRGLHDWIASEDRSMTWSAKKTILRQLAEAVASCHHIGVFHGDIKPSNVMARCSVSAAGDQDVQATLLDFGAACLYTSSQGLLPHGEGLYGSVAFMAPEQVQACQYRRQGMPRGPLRGPPADCWAVGLVAFQLFTGSCLFSTKSKDMPQELIGDLEGARVWYEERLAKEHNAWYTSANSSIRQRFESAIESLASTGDATDVEIKEFQDFVKRVLKRGPMDRLTALGMLNHAFLAT